MSRYERRHHRDDVEDRYQEEDDRRYRDRGDGYRRQPNYRDYEEQSEVTRAPSDRAVSEFILDAPRYDLDEQERYEDSTGRRGAAGRHRDRSRSRSRYDDDDKDRYSHERGGGAGGGGGRYDDERERYDDRERDHYEPDEQDASEIYAEAHRPAARSELSHYAPSHRTQQSAVSNGTLKTKTSRHGNLMMETMAAPHPCCPNTKGVCCLMLLLNLAILLIALGFVIVLQLFHPPFVWFIGLVLLIGGFCTLIFCLVYCVWVCKDAHRVNDNGELYWTHHWQKQWGYQPSEKPSEPYRERY